MKKIFVILLATILLFSMVIPAYAALPDPPASPQYSYIETYDSGLSINQTTGIATCSASCFVYGNNTIKIEYVLQRYMGSYWGTVKTWTSSGTSYASLSKSRTVDSGYTYCGDITFRVYNSAGRLLETGNVTETYSYPSP